MHHPEQMMKRADEARTRIREISSAQAAALIVACALVIDVRSEGEFRASHLPGALHLSGDALATRIGEFAPDPNTCILVYCALGHRSAIAADTLQRLGYRNVSSLRGGLRNFHPPQATRAVA